MGHIAAIWAALEGGGVAAPSNVAISGTATIGQTLTASATGTVTSWQWKRNGSNIGGATNSTYALVDADFGCPITVTATNAGGSATSAATALVAEAPAQTYTERLANNTFDSDTTWTKGTGWSIGSDKATKTAGGGGVLSQAVSNAAGIYYTLFDVTDRTGGSAAAWYGSSNGALRSAVGTYAELVRVASLTTLGILGDAGFGGSVDNVYAGLVTPNAALTAPSANMRLTQLYTLPASPVAGDQLWLLPRISDFAAGNYWLVLLQYTGSQWDINLYSVATHTRTSRIAATNIGATNGIRVNANGSSWTLETTANGGTNWTSRGTATNSTYDTATGVNAIATSEFTFGNLSYEAAA